MSDNIVDVTYPVDLPNSNRDSNQECSDSTPTEEANRSAAEESKSRKRGRKKCIPAYATHMTPQDLQKERNKRNAKNSRKKKKTYIETLEKRVADLELELQKAYSQISVYKSKEHLYQTGDRSGHSELIKTQEYIKQKGPEIVMNEKDSHQHLISYLSSKYGADGSERRKVIKNAFKVIFDNIVPDIHKVFIYHTKRQKDIPKEEFSKTMKKIKCTKKALSELKEEDRLFYEFLIKIDMDKEQKKLFKEKSVELEAITQKYRMIIREMIKLRKNFLDLAKVLKLNIGSQIQMLTKQQLLSFIEHFKNVEHSQFFKFHSLWEIKAKKYIEETIDEVDLTASDNENYQEDQIIDDEIFKDISFIQNIKEEYKMEHDNFGFHDNFEQKDMNNHKLSKIVDLKNTEFCGLKSPNFEQDFLSIENYDFMQEESDSEIEFLAKNQYNSLN